MPMTYKKSFEVFDKYYSLWNSHPEYKPTAILAAHRDYSGGIAAVTFERVILGIDSLGHDNALAKDIEKIISKMGSKRTFTGGVKGVISRRRYDELQNRVQTLVPDLFTPHGDQIVTSFHNIWYGIDSGSIVGQPDQIRDFYEACFNIAAFLKLSPPARFF